MRIGLLGELELAGGDGPEIAITGAKQRALVAILALHAGRTVATDHLVDALWGEAPPPGVRNGLQGLVSKVRRALGPAAPVVMRGGGYALELPPDAVDVHRFERLVAEGRAAAAGGDLGGAVHRLREAEALWRGDALAEFAYDDWAAPVVTRLSELRLAVMEERLDLELQQGRHHGAIPELETLVALHPLRERLRGLLMTALYRAGRQGDALRTFQAGRQLLVDELGLQPSEELRQLEVAILDHDPSLRGPVAEAEPTPAAPERSGIPEPLTPLVGRDVELADLGALLHEHRLVTLVGPGGVGKTRLALEVARARSATLPDGGCLVELAPVGDADGVRPAITYALGLPDPGRLTEMIGDRQLLLLLDNCEHVVAAAATTAEDLLRRCPGLRIVATSREGLRVGGETIWPVPPLAAADARELFVARARAAGTRLELGDELRPAIDEICTRLDGLPLAIELAAARTRAFPVRQLAARLNDRFRLLTGGSRTALPRQQTLRAVVDWSYELLFEDEQRVFERLAVFPGGCDLATAEDVCADETLPAAELEDIIQALVEKSLLVPVPATDDLRVRQLQILCQYGREKLADRGDAKRIRDAMAAHYARLCGESASAYVGDRQRAWLAAIDTEQDNLRAALEWAVDNDDAETALTIAGGASWPHWLAGTWVEGLRWLDDAFACRGQASEAARALARTGRGLLRFQTGVREGVDEDLAAALAVFRELGDVPSIALASSFYAEVAVARGDTEEARSRRRALLAFYERCPDDPFICMARAFSRAKLSALDRDLAAAEGHYREAVDWLSRIDRPVMRAMCLSLVAEFDERAGRYGAASEALAEAVEIGDALGLRGFTGAQLVRLGWQLLQQGDTARAEPAYTRALDVARRLRNPTVAVLALVGQAALHRLGGRDAMAGAAAREALELHQAVGPSRLANRVDPHAEMAAGVAVCCVVLAGLAAEAGAAERAALLLGHAEHLRRDADLPVPSFQREELERTRAAGVAELGADAFAAAFEQGRQGRLGHEVAPAG